MKNIRNFAIIAHVDHGKSTLSDRFLELTGVVKAGEHEEQFLDRNPISRERGITIKLAPVRMVYQSGSTLNFLSPLEPPRSREVQSRKKLVFSPDYILNLIDTPGHVDFSYEVDRTLACVEGVILLVDATQGVEAQTIANIYKALEKDLTIIPVVNKIDLPTADIQKTKKQLVDFLGVKEEDIFEISAKTGEGVEELLKAVVDKIPSPDSGQVFRQAQDTEQSRSARMTSFWQANVNERVQNPLQALIFDSYYDSHRGVIAFVRLFAGELKRGMKVKLSATSQHFEVIDVGYLVPELKSSSSLLSGEIGYAATNLKNIHQVQVGDTLLNEKSTASPLTGYKKVKPMVFASVFPTDTDEYPNLKKALEKLYLNDSSLEFFHIHSRALGAGFRVGFLGVLHADVVRERLEREFNLSLVLTPPQVEYHLGREFMEPYAKIFIVTPSEYYGQVMQLIQNYRGKFINMNNVGRSRDLSLQYEMPLSEMISDFFDNLKSVSSGYASLDWEFSRYEPVKADKLTVLLNGDSVEEFSEIVVEERAFEKANLLVDKLKEVIPRQQYEIKIQAKYKGKIIASQRIAPFKKDVTKKLYGGDRTRKDKLLERQKEGKKRLKMIGHVEIPKEAFLKLFKKT